MPTENLLFKKRIKVNDYISIEIPTVGAILEQEEDYYWMTSIITATPYDMMVQLDDMGIDFTQLNDFELFLLTFEVLKTKDTSMIFGSLDLSGFVIQKNTENDQIVLRNPNTDMIIDRSIHYLICQAIRKIHHFERENRKPANDEARKYLIERARKKLKRRRNKVETSQIEELIVALVNTEQFTYNFDTVQDLTIYQFNECVHQVVKKIDFEHRMHGIYSGTISAKDMSQSDLNWLTHK